MPEKYDLNSENSLVFTMWGANQSIIRSFVGCARKKNVSPKIIAKTLKCSPHGLFVSFWRIGFDGPVIALNIHVIALNIHVRAFTIYVRAKIFLL